MNRRFALLALILFLFTSIPLSALATENAAAPETDSPLVESRTATELPEKRKIPTSREIGIHPEESDRQIQARLQKIASSQEVFRNLTVRVNQGIVLLTGTAEETSVAKSFSALSERMEGVIGVVDQISVTDKSKTGLRAAQAETSALAQKFYRLIPYLLTALVILLLTFAIGFLFLRFWRYILLRKMARSPMLAETTARLLTAPIYILGCYLIFRVGGPNGLSTSVLGGTGVLGIVIGLAGQNILGNYLAGFMLTLRNPFKVGDQVSIGESTGAIFSVNSRCTMLLDGDGILVQIPNSLVLNSIIRNRSAHSMNQVTLKVPVEPGADIGDFRDAFRAAIVKNESAIPNDPEAQAYISTVVDGVVVMECTFWVDSIGHSVGKVRSNVLEALILGLEDREISLVRSAKFLRPDAKAFTESTNPAVERAPTTERSEKTRRGLDDSVEHESSVPSESKILEARAKEVKDPESSGLRSDLRKPTSVLSREVPPHSTATSS
jgi:small conductance mechanosensitive channel